MHRIDTDTAQIDKFGAGKNGFTGGNPQTGELPTALDEEFFDAIQEEISRVIEAAGISLDKGEYGQLLQAMGQLYAPLNGLNNKQDKHAKLTAFSGLTGGVNGLPYFTDNDAMAITALTATGRSLIGQSTIANMLSYLTAAPLASPVFTGEPKGPTAPTGTNTTQFATTEFVQSALPGAGVPVGIPLPWAAATPPSGWINCMGQTISQSAYPQLYSIYGATLPDLRGMFIRGWDNGRNWDTGRSLLTLQYDAIRNITGELTVRRYGITAGNSAFALSERSLSSTQSVMLGAIELADQVTFDASRVVPTASDNRPMNIAFNYIVRAA